MQAMVSKGIVHRDLKPQNILLSHDGRSKNPQPQDITLKIGKEASTSWTIGIIGIDVVPYLKVIISTAIASSAWNPCLKEVLKYLCLDTNF